VSVFAVLATGPSLTPEQVVRVQHLRLAPWAEALVSADRAWWKHHVPDFAGRKFSAMPVHGIDTEQLPGVVMGTNSGLLAVQVAVSLGAKRVLLLGFDMGGTHFFGPHPEGLKNTKPHRFEQFKRQFADYRPRGVEIINCTPGSALTCYPTATLDACLAEPAAPQQRAG
jgi:hypothetical protein